VPTINLNQGKRGYLPREVGSIPPPQLQGNGDKTLKPSRHSPNNTNILEYHTITPKIHGWEDG
jgi:hypothetical protein